MSLVLDFLKHLIPTLAMIAGGAVPLTFTIKALTTPKSTEESISLNVEESKVQETSLSPVIPITEVTPKIEKPTKSSPAITPSSLESTSPTIKVEPSQQETPQLENVNPTATISNPKPTNPSNSSKELQKLVNKWKSNSQKTEIEDLVKELANRLSSVS